MMPTIGELIADHHEFEFEVYLGSSVFDLGESSRSLMLHGYVNPDLMWLTVMDWTIFEPAAWEEQFMGEVCGFIDHPVLVMAISDDTSMKNPVMQDLVGERGLTTKQAKALLLSLCGYTQDEIAEKEGVTRDSIMSRLTLARNKLSEEYQ